MSSGNRDAGGDHQPGNPFLGLRPFESRDAELFFGRDRELDELLDRLVSHRFLAVHGPSGCGKSSLIRAGLIAALQGEVMAQDRDYAWRIAVMRPGNNPITQLTLALSRPEALGKFLGPEEEIAPTLGMILLKSENGLGDAAKYARLPFGSKLMILVDQFEELFRFAQDKEITGAGDEAESFVRLLLEAATQSEYPIYITMTMRSEFIGHCGQFPALTEVINQGAYLLGQMTRAQYRQMIEGPIALRGASIEPALVERILSDLRRDADQLPLLQHMMMRLWDQWLKQGAQGSIDFSDYERIGPLSAALEKHLKEVYRELSVKEREIADKLFVNLVEEQDGQSVRDPKKVAELIDKTGATFDQLSLILEAFSREGRSFLTRSMSEELNEDSMIDLTHESLIRQWKDLRKNADLQAIVNDQEKMSEISRSNLQSSLSQSDEVTSSLGSSPATVADRYDENLQPNPGLYWLSDKITPIERVGPGEIDAQSPLLIMIHGTASRVETTFGMLRETEEWRSLRRFYNQRIAGFEQRTLSRSPIDNALVLAELLPAGATIHLLTHDCGGLVGELLSLQDDDPRMLEPFKRAGRTRDVEGRTRDVEKMSRLIAILREKRFLIEKYVRVACPARGSTVASRGLKTYISFLTKLLPSGQKQSPFVNNLIRAALEVVRLSENSEDMPGLDAMMPHSPLIQFLNGLNLSTDADLAVIAGAAKAEGLYNRFRLYPLEVFFREEHDWVVNTRSMDGGLIRRQGAFYFYDQGPEVNHFNYFANQRTRVRIANWLTWPKESRDPAFVERRPAEVDARPGSKDEGKVEANTVSAPSLSREECLKRLDQIVHDRLPKDEKLLAELHAEMVRLENRLLSESRESEALIKLAVAWERLGRIEQAVDRCYDAIYEQNGTAPIKTVEQLAELLQRLAEKQRQGSASSQPAALSPAKLLDESTKWLEWLLLLKMTERRRELLLNGYRKRAELAASEEERERFRKKAEELAGKVEEPVD